MTRATWLADVLKDAGLAVKPYAGWETRGKSDFAPLGVIWHHTVTPATTADSAVDKFLALTGNATTPAPLCNYSTNRDGTISVIAAGTANHGGVGEWLGVSGNRYYFGDEMKNAGKTEPWPEIQLEASRVAAAAVLTFLKAEPEWLCGHKEYALPAGRKVDPHTLNMNTERGLVRAIMEDDMPLSQADLDAIWQYPVPDEDDGTGTRGAVHALRQTWKYSKAGATPGGGTISPADMEAIADLVVQKLRDHPLAPAD